MDHLDARLPRLREAAEEVRRQTPPNGWIKAIRGALGMSDRTFAKRLGVIHSTVQQMERNEIRGSITLESLRRTAEALDADLVYAMVPRKPLRAVIRDRARALALERLKPIAHSMALEEQSLSDQQFDRQVTALAAELEKKPHHLWR